MTITVYWSEVNNIHVTDPSNVWNDILKKHNDHEIKNYFTQCPVVIDQYKNVFSIKSPFDFMLRWNGNSIDTNMYDPGFFNNVVQVRNENTGVFSYHAPTLLFVPDKSVSMEQRHATHGRGEFSEKTSLIEGVFDPHRHIRAIEAATIFNQPSSINIKEDDDLYYVKFHTKEKIKFKRFFMPQELAQYVNGPLSFNREYTKNTKTMEWWYQLSRIRGTTKRVLKHAKNNSL